MWYISGTCWNHRDDRCWWGCLRDFVCFSWELNGNLAGRMCSWSRMMGWWFSVGILSLLSHRGFHSPRWETMRALLAHQYKGTTSQVLNTAHVAKMPPHRRPLRPVEMENNPVEMSWNFPSRNNGASFHRIDYHSYYHINLTFFREFCHSYVSHYQRVAEKDAILGQKRGP